MGEPPDTEMQTELERMESGDMPDYKGGLDDDV